MECLLLGSRRGIQELSGTDVGGSVRPPTQRHRCDHRLFHVDAEGNLVVVGANGSGKTNLFHGNAEVLVRSLRGDALQLFDSL